MSVFSLKTAVTCENPLREIERVLSRPGMPASAVSIRNVTCFSISAGDSTKAVVLTCTCLLVMAGTASIGSRDNDQAPSAMTPMPDRTTSQRFWIDSARMRLIMLPSVFMLDLRLAELGLEDEGVLRGDMFTDRQAAGNLHNPRIPAPDAHLARFKSFGVAYEQDRFTLERLQRRDRHALCGDLFVDRDLRRDEGSRPPLA